MSKMPPIIIGVGIREGGLMTWTNKVTDSGKETIGGISIVHQPNWAGWVIVEMARKQARARKRSLGEMNPFEGEGPIHEPVIRQFLTPELADALKAAIIKFYHDNAWINKRLKVHTTDIDNQAIATKLYDIKFNGGDTMLRTLVKTLQGCIGCTADGIFGQGTLAKLNTYCPEPISGTAGQMVDECRQIGIITTLAERQMKYYARIVQKGVREQLEDASVLLARTQTGGFTDTPSWRRWVDADVKKRYNETNAGNLVGWVSRAFEGTGI